MSTVSHQPMGERRHWLEYMTKEVGAAIAITSMWVAVAVSAVWGPDFVSSTGGGTNSTTIPSAIFVAIFACVGSWLVAKHAFRSRHGDN